MVANVLAVPLTILHLSDLHISQTKQQDVQIVLDALWADLDAWQQNGVRPDLVCFTGDIAQAGKVEEYDLAQRLLFDPLLDHLSQDRDRLFLVPGNHDIDRDVVRRDYIFDAGLEKLLTDRDSVNRVLDVHQDRVSALARLEAYAAFMRGYFGELLGEQDPSYFTARHVEVNGLMVGVAGVNSAWRSRGDQDRTRLLIGERQLHAARAALGGARLRIVLMHHPFTWLHQCENESQEWDAEAYCMRTFHLVLSGHLHAGNVTEYRSPQGRVVVHSSGSLFQGRRPGHLEGYSLIQLGEWCDVYLRRFVPRRGEFIPDIESAPEGGVFRYKLELDADDRRGPRLEAERYGSDA